MRSREITSSTLGGAALQRIEPYDPEYPAHEQPSWQQHAHGPATRPQTLASPLPSRRPRWDSCGKKEQIPRAGSNELDARRNCGGSGMGVGEGIGSDGPGGRDWRREGERGKRRRERGEEEVRTGGFLFLFCLNKRLRGFLSPFFLLLGFLDGCCLVMCSPSLLLSLSSVGRRCLLPPSRSLAFSLL